MLQKNPSHGPTKRRSSGAHALSSAAQQLQHEAQESCSVCCFKKTAPEHRFRTRPGGPPSLASPRYCGVGAAAAALASLRIRRAPLPLVVGPELVVVSLALRQSLLCAILLSSVHPNAAHDAPTPVRIVNLEHSNNVVGEHMASAGLMLERRRTLTNFSSRVLLNSWL